MQNQSSNSSGPAHSNNDIGEVARGTVAVVYIVGIGHSGTTLLDLLISAHPDAASVGEIIALADYWYSRRSRTPMTPFGNECTCGAETIGQCEFWLNVDRELRNELRSGIRSINPRARIGKGERSLDGPLFRAIARVADSDMIVDSSKDCSRLERLLKNDELEVVPVFLWRNALGVVNSQKKKGIGIVRASIGIVSQVLRIVRALHNKQFVFVDYDELTRVPEKVLASIMEQTALEFDPAQLDFGTAGRHSISGNRMRRVGRSEVRQDDSWKTQLSPAEKRIARFITFPSLIVINFLRRRSVAA